MTSEVTSSEAQEGEPPRYSYTVWVADENGKFFGEHEAHNVIDSLETFRANLAKLGRTAIEKGADPAATRPADPPKTAEQLAVEAKQERLGELRTKGWAALTAEEKTEAQALGFDLGMYVPPV